MCALIFLTLPVAMLRVGMAVSAYRVLLLIGVAVTETAFPLATSGVAVFVVEHLPN